MYEMMLSRSKAFIAFKVIVTLKYMFYLGELTLVEVICHVHKASGNYLVSIWASCIIDFQKVSVDLPNPKPILIGQT